MDNQEYDFYETGKKRAEEGFDNLVQLANYYGETFGPKAKADFLNGVASAVPQYQDTLPFFPYETEQEIISNYEKMQKDTRRF